MNMQVSASAGGLSDGAGDGSSGGQPCAAAAHTQQCAAHHSRQAHDLMLPTSSKRTLPLCSADMCLVPTVDSNIDKSAML